MTARTFKSVAGRSFAVAETLTAAGAADWAEVRGQSVAAAGVAYRTDITVIAGDVGKIAAALRADGWTVQYSATSIHTLGPQNLVDNDPRLKL